LLDGERGGALVPNDVITAHCMLLNGVSSATLTVAPAAKAGGTARAGSSGGHICRVGAVSEQQGEVIAVADRC
jgi:hypothetical protein